METKRTQVLESNAFPVLPYSSFVSLGQLLKFSKFLSSLLKKRLNNSFLIGSNPVMFIKHRGVCLPVAGGQMCQ